MLRVGHPAPCYGELEDLEAQGTFGNTGFHCIGKAGKNGIACPGL